MKNKKKTNVKEHMQSLDWTLKYADMKENTHNIHVYPARMPPLLIRRLIDNFSEKDDLILDPFMGSGTVTLEAFINKRRSIGVDVNPLAVKIAQVKSKIIDPRKIKREFIRVLKNANMDISKKKDIYRMKFLAYKKSLSWKTIKWLDYWFLDYVQFQLFALKEIIRRIRDEEIREFFQIILSDTARWVSNNRNSSYKNYRISEEKMRAFRPKVFQTFNLLYHQALISMHQLTDKVLGKYSPFESTKHFLRSVQKETMGYIPKLYNENFLDIDIKPKSVDLIITSPPYGDSKTTVAYGQFSKYSLFWLGQDPYIGTQVDKEGLGGRKLYNLEMIHSKLFYKLKRKIKKNEKDMKNPTRHNDFHLFFQEYQKSIEKMSKCIKDGKFVCVIVGNRSVRGVKILMDEMTVEIARYYGLKHYISLYRDIPNKRHPTSQKLVKFDSEDTTQIDNINKETIIILRKTD